jgi:PHD/YefM family antitoxin component YafN of YafNO toxin-antitoxin module
MKTQFVTDKRGKKLAVILPIQEYQKMLDDLEELEDIKLYDAVKKGKQEFIDAEQAFQEIEEARRKNEDL